MDEVTGVEEKKRILVGFTFQPIFRVEDTESEPLSEYEPMQLPRWWKLPSHLACH